MVAKTLIPEAALRRFATEALTAAGMRAAHAGAVADTLLYADLRGVGSHGVARLGSYLDRVKAGVMQVDPEMAVTRDMPSAALLDAANGFGQLAGIKAMELAIDKAGQTGAGAVVVAHSNHFGVAAYFVEMAARAGKLGIVMTNASPAMVPWNTRVPLLGTNPIAFGVPAGSEAPIVLDMSTSLVARGKIRLAALTGQKIPLGWAVDAEGLPTEDAAAAMKGSLAPVGGPKGAGLSLVIDLLTGVLSNSAMTGQVRNIADTSGPSATGHLFIALDVAAFIEPAVFGAAVDGVIRHIRGLPSADGSPVRLPGEIEAQTMAQRRADGIPVPQDVIAALTELAGRLELAAP